MRKFKRLTMTLALLLALTTGAWAQGSEPATDPNEVNVTPVTGKTNQRTFTVPAPSVDPPILPPEFTVTVNRDGETNKWTFTMPASNVELQVEYEPSYNVTFNTEGLDAEEAARFSAQPNTGVYKDETVTVTYTGTKRLIGFKAVKKAAAPSVPDGAINGKFSVSDSKQVYFSKGNLRYASGAWSFFDNQYDYYNSYSADAWDHFCWSTSADTYGMNISTDKSTYSGDFVDWGATMDTGWFTLSSAEWTYLFYIRSASTVGGTENGHYAKAKVNDVQGVILFPDTYTHPDGVTAPTNVNTASASFDSNTYTVADWTKMESAGCVFLPATDSRYGSSVNFPSSHGYYWSATPDGTERAYRVHFSSDDLSPAGIGSRYFGYSVRLVREVTE